MGTMDEFIGGWSSHSPSFNRAPHLKGSLASTIRFEDECQTECYVD